MNFLKTILLYITVFSSLVFYGQDFSELWTGHFSYNNVKAISEGNNKIYAASDNAVFSLDILTNEIKEISTINGLSGEDITTIFHSETYELLVIGYENGLIEIVFDNTSEVLTFVDISNKSTIPPTERRINHFNPYQNVLYISTNFGISILNLERLEFGDTYFIGPSGSQIQVSQTAIFDNYIYAACLSGNGIRRGSLSNSNLIDFNNWERINSGSWTFIEPQNDKLYAINTGRRLFEVRNGPLTQLAIYSQTPSDLRVIEDHTIVTTANSVFVYDRDFNLLSTVEVNAEFDTNYSVSQSNGDAIYVGTKDFGILKTSISNPTVFEEIHPDGPLLNTPFCVEAEDNGVWVTYGDYDLFFNPYPLKSEGYSHLRNGTWRNMDFENIFNAMNLTSIAINPFNRNHLFISSYKKGLLEINNGMPETLYNEDNSGLDPFIRSLDNKNIGIWLGASEFDSNGLLWSMSGRVESPLKSYDPSANQWRSYSFKEIISDSENDELGFGDIAIGDDGTKWIASYRNGIIGYNENNGSPLIRSVSREDQNMPTDLVNTIAIDKRNNLWVGTFRGLRILFNTSIDFFSRDNIRVQEVIIEEEGVAKELLFQENITDIEVDGANNKWVATSDSGVFYFSPNGQNTIFHFTKDNSPLPTNSISDISIDNENGIIYIATTKGLVSYKSGGSGTSEELTETIVYPNPVRPNFDIVEDKVKIKGLSENVNIKITDIEGNLVAEAQSGINSRFNAFNLEIDGGTAFWNGKNLRNNIVASGVYLVMIADLDTFETKVLKLLIVR